MEFDQEIVGKEFDKWLDWNGTADEATTHFVQPTIDNRASCLPVSPISTANSDSFNHNSTTTPHTAPYTNDLPTPSNSSGSPDTFLNPYRLSGDTLHSDSSSMLQQNTLKRKLSSNDDPEQEYKPVAGRPTGSKRPHNVIEKRYRANLNVKIAELRDSVPALRILKKAKGKKDVTASSDEEDLDGLTPSNKLNKASILTKAVEYIRHLEFRTKKLEEENRALKDRLQVLDKVLADGGNDAARASAFTSETVIEQSPESSNQDERVAAEPKTEVKGLIGIPDSFRQLREAQPQEHYGHVYQTSTERSRLSGKWPQRIMLGSLAGLMIMEGFSESDTGDDSQKKALFGIPLEILDGWTFLRSPRIYLATFAEYCRAGGVLPLVKGFMALSILAFLIFYYMFNSKPAAKQTPESDVHEAPVAARPASPIEVRRRAWSTSMQALGLPHHSFFPEWFAVTSEWVNYSIRYWLGPSACLWMCGETAEDEIARIKAWDIAIDAQLAGGDHEICRSRSVLTIFGSGTLPATPLRLMMKAIHTKVVLHNVGLAGTLSSRIASRIATSIADKQWRRARQMHEALPARDPDRLPGYLNYLLQMDCDDVFSTSVTQRAFNMMYDRPTSEHTEDSLMDVVAEDYAIRSPLDAIAAWRSTTALHEALTTALQSADATDLLREHTQAALEIAPPGSAAECRALAVHAVLSPGRRRAFYSKAADAVVPTSAIAQDLADEQVPFFIDSSTPASARAEIATCLSCAEVMLKLEQEQDLAGAIETLCRIKWPDLGIACSGSAMLPTMLSVAPLYFVLTRLLRASRRASDCYSTDCEDNVHPLPQLDSLAQEVCHCLRTEAIRRNISLDDGQKSYLTPAIDMLSSCWHIRSLNPFSRRQSNASHDTGYGSMEEEDTESTRGLALKNATTAFEKSDGHLVQNIDALAVSV
ncbi:Clr6 histone deacetylase associated PHD protein-2 Cph2 [Knufia obscura]|uniref:Clr6 histone deacetylase associated PHD protein-2 Cph2 n=2 Tax=Knufia TaxID=430999 RepID=A0AAN8EMP7_9EURO|nr:Clr6 histone deacetylase associated PHD protein-2 Cph2 [Knufia obscura]KAK5954432.1 Clr6 histone deacetylase associated PHD protein-2 Cph2 [Knufia fluminis]